MLSAIRPSDTLWSRFKHSSGLRSTISGSSLTPATVTHGRHRRPESKVTGLAKWPLSLVYNPRRLRTRATVVPDDGVHRCRRWSVDPVLRGHRGASRDTRPPAPAGSGHAPPSCCQRHLSWPDEESPARVRSRLGLSRVSGARLGSEETGGRYSRAIAVGDGPPTGIPAAGCSRERHCPSDARSLIAAPITVRWPPALDRRTVNGVRRLPRKIKNLRGRGCVFADKAKHRDVFIGVALHQIDQKAP